MYLGGLIKVRSKIMHSFRRIFVGFLLTILSTNLIAQVSVQTNLVNADKNRLAYNYSKSLKLYKEVLTVDAQNTHALDAIIDIYMYDYELYDSAKVYLDQRINIFKPDTNYLVYYI